MIFKEKISEQIEEKWNAYTAPGEIELRVKHVYSSSTVECMCVRVCECTCFLVLGEWTKVNWKRRCAHVDNLQAITVKSTKVWAQGAGEWVFGKRKIFLGYFHWSFLRENERESREGSIGFRMMMMVMGVMLKLIKVQLVSGCCLQSKLLKKRAFTSYERFFTNLNFNQLNFGKSICCQSFDFNFFKTFLLTICNRKSCIWMSKVIRILLS